MYVLHSLQTFIHANFLGHMAWLPKTSTISQLSSNKTKTIFIMKTKNLTLGAGGIRTPADKARGDATARLVP